MAEQNPNFNPNAVNPAAGAVTDSTSITLNDIFDMVLRKWYWFAISIVTFLFVGVLYIMKTQPVYNRNATIMVKDSRKGSGVSEVAAFSELAGMSARRNVDNELFVLQARRLMVEVVERLNLAINYTTRQGMRMVDLYKRTPINVRFVNNNDKVSCSFQVLLLEDGVEISNLKRPKAPGVDPKQDKLFAVKAMYGEAVELPIGQVIIDQTLYMDEEFIGKTINVSKSNKDLVAARYRNATKSSVANKMSSIINITLNDVVAQRAEDVINTLIAVYNDDAVYDKQQIAEATADFIDERLAIINKELGSVDNEIQTFKSRNNMVDIQSDIKQSMTESSKLKSEGLSVDSQIEMAKFVRDYLNDTSKEYRLIPITTLGDGLQTTSLSKQIADYNDLLLRREKLVQNGATNNPVLQQIESNRAAMKNAILESLHSTIATLEIKLANLRREENKTNLRISSVPSQEKEYLTIARQQRIKEELYLYLLNKREENAISLAITENSARIIDPAFGSPQPVAPRRPFILLVMLALGIAVPFTIFYVRKILDTTVHSKRDIERNTRVPYLGDIPVYDGRLTRGIAVREHGHDQLSEAFRIIRTNMSFMNTNGDKQQVIQVTSSNAHAGKTFVSINLGMTLAYSGNKVLMIDLDLRRRTMSKHMGQRHNPIGVSKFISDAHINVKDVISKSDLHENFDFIYAGLQPPNPAEMLLSSRLDDLINECREYYDYIIIDSVPAMVIADALISSRVADVSLYIVREGLLDRNQLPEIDSLYRENKLKNMCIILNGASERNHRYGYTYDSSGDERETFLAKIAKAIGLSKLLRRHDSRRSLY